MMRCRPSLTETARHVDRAIEGRSLLTTGLELARAANPLTPSQGLVLRRAEDKAGSLRPAATLPIAGGTRLFPPAACVAALLAVSATVEPPGPSPAERVVSLPVPGQISPAPREGSSVEPAGTPGKIDVAEVGASPPQPAAGLGGGVVQTRVPATTTATDEQPESAEPHPGRAFVAASGGQGDEPGVSAGAGGKPRGTQPPPEESAGVGLSVELPVAETLQRAGPMPGAAGTIAGEPGSAVEAVAVPAARPAAPSALAALTPIERRYAARYFERLGEEP